MHQKIYDIKKRSYVFGLEIVRFLEILPKDYIALTIGKQLLRSATSIGANIIEAQGASTKKDFTNFYNHALKTANETKYWLNLLKDSGKGSNEKVQSLLEETTELANIIASCIISLRRKL